MGDESNPDEGYVVAVRSSKDRNRDLLRNRAFSISKRLSFGFFLLERLTTILEICLRGEQFFVFPPFRFTIVWLMYLDRQFDLYNIN
jgi:hypothetical protein